MRGASVGVREEELRRSAVTRLRKKAELRTHLIAYVAVNTALLAIWGLTGGGFFWPAFPALGWGIGIALHARDVYGPGQASEGQIRREMARMSSSGPAV
jgi:hypothetical protein